MDNSVILSFNSVTFEYVHNHPLLEDVSFTVRRGAKLTLMGQNGAGKSTIFGMIKGTLKPTDGNVTMANGVSIATAVQVVNRDDLGLTIEHYFEKQFEVVPGTFKADMHKAMEAVNFDVPVERKVGDLSGGQQARLLLAAALIQKPDILLLDEPTNNLDTAGIDHLIAFLMSYDKTVIVISHDAAFLNCFTEGVLYLDAHSKKVEVYVGDYYTVVEEIAARVERERKKNAQYEKQIQDRKDKVNFFAHKGGKMRKLAKKLQEQAEDMEESKVEVRQEDKTIRDFKIPAQEIVGDIVKINQVKIVKDHEPIVKDVEITLRQKSRLLISGPNGIGKSTLLRSLITQAHEGVTIMEGTRVGYYSQDFATLNFDQTVFESLMESCLPGTSEKDMRAVAGGLLISGELMGHKISYLSEGQKGLLSFARLILMKPGLLVLDEPTNHINFRHIPVIAKAINEFQGCIILISHMPEFVEQIKVTDYLDLGKL